MKENKHKVYTVESLVANERFQNFCLGKSEADKIYWEDIIFKHWTQRETFAKAHDLVLSLSDLKTYQSTSTEAKVVQLMPPSTTKTFSIRRLGSIAAIVLLVVVSWSISHYSTDTPIYITQTTAANEVRELVLPDSSVVVLNSNSSLTYQADMSKQRELTFTGEAFFEVRTTPERQNFTVSVPEGTIEVTGTKFNLKRREDVFEATLVEGTIIYKHTAMKDITLKAADQLRFEDNIIRVKKVDTQMTTDWVEGRMIYNDIKVGVLIEELVEDYDLTILVKNPKLEQRTISANMLTSDPRVLLRSIGAIYDFEVEEVDEKIILK